MGEALITTTVSVDAQNQGDLVKIHLVQGDAGTRRLQLVPTSGGRPISLDNVADAKVRAQNIAEEPLLINCSIDAGKIYMVPTAALVERATEWACQLVLLNSEQETLSSMPFTIITHGTVYDGDAVEHTSDRVSGMEWNDATKELVIVLESGTRITCDLTHTHAVVTAVADGFFPHGQYAALQNWITWLNQGVATTDTPTFAGLHVGGLYIDGDGIIHNARFT